MVAKKSAAATAPAKAAKEAPAHPPYGQMITTAITELKDKKGSSRAAIIKYLQSNYSVGDNCAAMVKRNLIRMSNKNELVHAKTTMTGASGSFKLPSKNAEKTGTTPKKTPKKASPKKESPVKASPKKAASPKKKAASPKKPAAKKAAKK